MYTSVAKYYTFRVRKYVSKFFQCKCRPHVIDSFLPTILVSTISDKISTLVSFVNTWTSLYRFTSSVYVLGPEDQGSSEEKDGVGFIRFIVIGFYSMFR